MKVICQFCKQETDPNRSYEHVSGWSKHRAGGGMNAIALRKTSGRFACRSCIEDEKYRESHNLNAGQESLL